jgi:multiple sugar transport system ATP-binding protein
MPDRRPSFRSGSDSICTISATRPTRRVNRPRGVEGLPAVLSNLDAQLRLLMRVEIKRLQRALEITTVLVTHDQIEAMTMADRIVLMKDGVVQQIGAPRELYSHPRTAFVGGFIGSPSMNFLSGRVAVVDGRPVVEPTDSVADHLPLSPPMATRLGDQGGRALTLGIRPEDVTLSLVPAPDGIPGRIVDVEPLGRELAVAVSVGRQYVVALAPPTFTGRPEDPVQLTFPPDRLHAFDPETGAVLT